MGQRQRRRRNIEHRQQRHLRAREYSKNRQHRAEHAAVKCAGGLQHRDAENFARIRRVIIPVAENSHSFETISAPKIM